MTTMKQDIKNRYSDQELNEFKTLIERKLVEARKQLEFYLTQISEHGAAGATKVKGLDDAIGAAENERMTLMAARQQKHIKHLENALIRIQNKVYGLCRNSGKLISKARLRAVPHATLSIEAKQSQIRRRRR